MRRNLIVVSVVAIAIAAQHRHFGRSMHRSLQLSLNLTAGDVA